MEKKHWELSRLRDAIEREKNWKPLKPLAMKKVLAYLQGHEKPKKEVLDKISLFVGFQDWDSFRDALHGNADASTNYEDVIEEGETSEHSPEPGTTGESN